MSINNNYLNRYFDFVNPDFQRLTHIPKTLELVRENMGDEEFFQCFRLIELNQRPDGSFKDSVLEGKLCDLRVLTEILSSIDFKMLCEGSYTELDQGLEISTLKNLYVGFQEIFEYLVMDRTSQKTVL
ncbi:hypothetical protein [Marinobacterium sp. xm-d-530]|uniref:hypothetical protein n=1 Tax=Marinobacterium sp. xm-d-530 TaxID=2497747 RepID=UPI0015693C3B|nr:hypothetical protein [Marinobacterium sp. xm-d-530]NRQ02233.1 hypothetical protein [Marinobacterium sp. xm-d-530]